MQLYTEEEIYQLISDSIKRQSAILHIQPIYDTAVGAFTCAEILSRIDDGRGNIIYPSNFIPQAEKNGLICEFGYMLMHNILKFIKSTQLSFRYSFNVSPIQLESPDFAERLIRIIQGHNADSRLLTAEITESVPYSINHTFLNNIEKLQRFGLSFALDDIGKGSSDIVKAARMPIMCIKIDKEYINRMHIDLSVRLQVENIIMFAHKKNLKIIAEGVETKQQMQFLTDLNCDYLQGYYFSKPLPADCFKLQILKNTATLTVSAQ